MAKQRQSKKNPVKNHEPLPPAEEVIAPVSEVATTEETPVEIHSQEEIKKDAVVSVNVGGVVVTPPDKLLVDKKLFYETMSALVKGYTHGFTAGPAISKFTKMQGAKDRKEELALWDECQKYLKEHK